MHDDIDIDRLADDAHGPQIVCRDGHDEYAVMVVVGSLHIGQIRLDLLALFARHIGQEDGVLDAETAFTDEVARHQTTHLVALDVIHHKKKHIGRIMGSTVCQVQDAAHALVKALHVVRHAQDSSIAQHIGAGESSRPNLVKNLCGRHGWFGFARHRL